METKFMHIEMPENTSLYVFGSFLISDDPKDLDILVVYDPQICFPEFAYKEFMPFFESLKEVTGLQVDATILTYTELKQSNFLALSNAIEFNKCKELSKHFTGFITLAQ